MGFIESGWDVKQLLKIMVMSATYQQASTSDESQLAFDSENRWLGRGAQQRLTAEMLCGLKYLPAAGTKENT